MGKSWSSWSLISPCSTQAFVSSQAGRCLEHCLMNPFHLPAMQFTQQPFLCSSIRLALTDAILHSQVDHRREQISFWEGAYGPLHLDKLSSQNRLEWVLEADWAGTDVLGTAYPWSLEQITSLSRTALQPCILMVEMRCVCVCNHFGRPMLGVSPAGSRRRWAWRTEQRGCLTITLLSWMFGLQFIPSHSISLSRMRDLGSDQDKQLARTSTETDKTAGESDRDRDKHLPKEMTVYCIKTIYTCVCLHLSLYLFCLAVQFN